jgi:hypothetical protein
MVLAERLARIFVRRSIPRLEPSTLRTPLNGKKHHRKSGAVVHTAPVHTMRIALDPSGNQEGSG